MHERKSTSSIPKSPNRYKYTLRAKNGRGRLSGSKGKKSERLFKKLSTREIEVLRYLNDGKKNKEVAQILGLDEKTISTYKLRLLAKLNVTNLVDLLKKAKDLEVI